MKSLKLAVLGTLFLNACSADVTESKATFKSKTSQGDTNLSLNYCHQGTDKAKTKAVQQIVLNLVTYDLFKSGPQKRMEEKKDKKHADLLAGILPSEDEFKRWRISTEVLRVILERRLHDTNAQLDLIYCNHDVYFNDKCAGAVGSRFIESASLTGLGDILKFTTKQGTVLTVGNPKNTDIKVLKDGVTSQWSRGVDGVESFTSTVTKGVKNWTENPDCSGRLSLTYPDATLDITWEPPKDESFTVNYEYCDIEGCIKDTL